MKNIFKNDNDIFKASVGSVTDVFELDDVADDVRFVEDKYLVKLIGFPQYTSLITSLYANNLNEYQETLLEKLRPAVSRLVIVARIPEVSCSFGNGGILVRTAEHSVPASQFKIELLLRSHRTKAYELLDGVIQYMEDNTAVFTDYATSPERTDRTNGIIINAYQFGRAYGHQLNFVIFKLILNFIRKIELRTLENAVGSAFYAQLITQAQKQANGESVEIHFDKPLRLAQDAVANLAMVTAIPSLALSIDEDGISAFDNSFNNESHNKRLSAPDSTLSLLIQTAQQEGKTALEELRTHLNSVASETVLPVYFTSEKYYKPSENIDQWRDDVPGAYYGG